MSRWFTILGSCLLVGVVAACPQVASAKSTSAAKSNVARSSARSMHRHAGKHHSGKHASARKHGSKRHHSAQVSKTGKRNQFRPASFNANKSSRRVNKSSGIRSVNASKFNGKNTRRFSKPTFNSKRSINRKQPVNAVKPPTTSSTTTVKKAS